jgi:uncharacterized OB-fold protein
VFYLLGTGERKREGGRVDAGLEESLRRFVGSRAGGVRVGRDPVNLPMIHHWVQVLEDRNPIYVDDAFARGTRHGGLVAPPSMLQTWTMDSLGAHADDDREEPANPALDLLDSAGYASVVATDYSHTYLRELRLGDRISRDALIEDVSGEKRTSLGQGFFVTIRYDYSDAAGEPVGVGRMRLLKYRPRGQDPGQDAGNGPEHDGPPPQPRPVVNRDTAHFWEGTRQRRLLIQRCAACGLLRHPPSPMCGACQSTAWDTVTSAGTGTVHSYVVHHHPPLPGFALPHVPVLVDLAEGVRMVSYLTADVDPGAVAIGMPVRVVFTPLDDEVTLPLFTPLAVDREAPEPSGAAALVFDKVTVGDELPPLRLDISATRVVATAIASRDYEAVHHDREEARRRGTRDIFLNILSSNGLALRYVTDWAGPEAVVTAASIRLGVPSYAGEKLVLTGRVTATDGRTGQVDVQVHGRSSLGTHLSGAVTITLPLAHDVRAKQ